MRKKSPTDRDLFKNQAGEYANFAKDSFSWKYIEKVALDKHLAPLLKNDWKVLDAGCGEGKFIQYLISKKIKEENIIGVDINEELISIARKRFPRAKFITSDIAARYLSFENLDLIASSEVFHFLDENQWDETLKHFYLWLKKGGILFYIVTHPVRFVHKNLREYFKRDWFIFDSPWGVKIPHFHKTVGDYINATIKAGFALEIVDEPEVLKEGKKSPDEYRKYTSFPSRLAIRAKK